MFFVYDWKFITCLCQPLERFVADLWPAGSSSQQCMWVAGKQWTQPLCLSSTFNPYWKHSFLFLEEKHLYQHNINQLVAADSRLFSPFKANLKTLHAPLLSTHKSLPRTLPPFHFLPPLSPWASRFFFRIVFCSISFIRVGFVDEGR